MAALFTVDELAVWTRSTIAADDEFALAVVDAASLLVAETARHPEWTTVDVPPRAKLIGLLLAKRTYLNPDAVSSSSVGPIAERVVEDFARTMELTEAETEALEAMRGDAESGASGFWIQPTNRGEVEMPIYLFEADSEEPIPFLDPELDPYYWPLLDEETA